MTDSGEILQLEGQMTAREVPALERRYRDRFKQRPLPSRVNLEQVASADSSALALLLEWQAQARKAGTNLHFDHPPQALKVIARLTGVALLLGWEQTAGDTGFGAQE